MIYDVAVIGGGPAGMTAALYTARGLLKTVVFEGMMPGGQAAATERIDNYPGFPGGANGFDLMQNFYKQAMEHGAEFRLETVRQVDWQGPLKKVYTQKSVLEARTVLIATGSKPRLLGVPGEELFRGQGVSYCATCDGAFFRDKTVAVVGGGNSALEEAYYLTRFAKEILLIHRRQEFRAAGLVVEKVKNCPQMTLVLDSVVEEIKGEGRVEQLVVKNVRTGESREIAADGIFIYVGTEPNLPFATEGLEKDERGYIVTDASLRTSERGVYAAGDVRDTLLRQVATAVGDGALAAVHVEKYLTEQ